VTITRHTPLTDLPELLRVEEAAAYLGIGKGLAYEMVRRGDLASVRLGRLVRVLRDGLAQKTAVER
jgi:excisionase family DNA binding protein